MVLEEMFQEPRRKRSVCEGRVFDGKDGGVGR